MNIVQEVWLIVLAFAFQTKISLQDCGERFVNDDEGSRSKRIIGGNEAVMNSWPWLVNFVDNNDNTFQVCSGNLIDPLWILTTAHCFVSNVFQYAVGEWKYIAGDHYLDKTDPYEQVLYPAELYIHPKFKMLTNYDPGDYDLALIRLKEPAKITRHVRTICLPNHTKVDLFNTTHLVAGWGNVQDTPDYKRSPYLKELRMDVIPTDICNSTYGGNLTLRQLCANHPGWGEDACFGDSGGPLQYMNEDDKWVLSGLVSWGRGCARKNFFGVYTNVKELLPYINKIMKDDKTCGVRDKTPLRPKRIVGGTEAAINAWPWAVNIISKRTKQQSCGGSIIASNLILTAAHCFLGEGRETFQDEFKYVVGDHVLGVIDKGQKEVVPEFMYIHPDYIPPTLEHPGNFDVCLIKLKYSLEWSDVISPVCLPDNRALLPAKVLRCFAIGWGNTEDKQEYKRPEALKQLRVNVVPQDKCNSNVSYNGSVPGTYFCAGFREGLNDTCYGDSGGPLQCDNGNDTWSVRGLVSWGNGCARPNKFGVYSNVSKLMPFLNQIRSGQDLLLRRIEKMTVEEIYKQNPSEKNLLKFCALSLFSIIQHVHPNVTAIDIVRSWAFIPMQVTALKIVSPTDAVLAFDWELQNTCKSKFFKDILRDATYVRLLSFNNATLRKFGERLNLTVDEMAFFLHKTMGTLLLTRKIQFDKLQKEINEGKLVEQKVSRLIELVTFLQTLQPNANLDQCRMNEIVRNFSYEVAKNLTDNSLKRIISRNNINVFTKYVKLGNLGIFFNKSLTELKERRLSEIVVDLIGVDLDDFINQFSNSNVKSSVENKISDVETHWDILSEKMTLEKLLIASRLMEVKFNCNHCDVRSEHFVPGCNVVCDRCSSTECLPPVNIIEGPKVSNIKLALIFGVFSGCLVALVIILLICFMTKQHRTRNASTSEKVMTDEELANDSLAASNNNIVFLPENKHVNGKNGSYLALNHSEKEENKCNGNLESIL